jgi:hypothetical protein
VEAPVTLWIFKAPGPPLEGEAIIVSLPLAQAWARIYVGPTGVYAPDTGFGAVRDTSGNIVGTEWLICVIG